jgi:hypothetical protein
MSYTKEEVEELKAFTLARQRLLPNKERIIAQYQYPDDAPKGNDALDKPRRRGKPSKKERQTYAKAKFVEDLILPPKNGIAPFLNNPALLPKRPPGKSSENDE